MKEIEKYSEWAERENELVKLDHDGIYVALCANGGILGKSKKDVGQSVFRGGAMRLLLSRSPGLLLRSYRFYRAGGAIDIDA